MNDFTYLDEAYNSLREDVTNESDGQAAKTAFQGYWDILINFFDPYVQDGFLDKEKGFSRFLSETAILNLMLSLISSWCLQDNENQREIYFRINPEAKHYSWYCPPESCTAKIMEWGMKHSRSDPYVPALIANNSLAKMRHRSLGEFFTPIDISKHLLLLSEFEPTSIVQKKVCDPACGSGNLLSSVVMRVTEEVLARNMDPWAALSGIGENLIGFDIQPIAVLITRFQLLMASIPILREVLNNNESIFEKLPLSNIQLFDPLGAPEKFTDIFAKFDLVLGNPPFLKVVKNKLPFISFYKEVISGQPNLYQLFLWWAIKATKPGGNISFILPQSIRSGQYFEKLRRKIANSCDITAITCLVDRTGVFDTVNQQIMVINFRKAENSGRSTEVVVRVNKNGYALGQANGIYLPRAQVIRTQVGIPLWCISDHTEDYRILERVCTSLPTLKEYENFEVVNGGFVWNQHKEKLLAKGNNHSSPLISSYSIGIHDFEFPPTSGKIAERLYVDRTEPISEPVYEQSAILLKRTTPKKIMGRRIIATYLPINFLEEHKDYFAENHVNLIFSLQEDENSQLGLTAWLNSRLANFIFSMMNGSSHISKFELEILPFPVSMLDELGKLAAPLYQINPKASNRTSIMNQIDEYIFKAFCFTFTERQRLIDSVPLV